MPVFAIDPVRAELNAAALGTAARRPAPSSAPRHLTASSSLAAAITALERRLAAADSTLGAQLVADAIELRSAADDVRRADR